MSHGQSQGLEPLAGSRSQWSRAGQSITPGSQLPTQEDSSDSPKSNPLEMGKHLELLQWLHLPQKPPASSAAHTGSPMILEVNPMPPGSLSPSNLGPRPSWKPQIGPGDGRRVVLFPEHPQAAPKARPLPGLRQNPPPRLHEGPWAQLRPRTSGWALQPLKPPREEGPETTPLPLQGGTSPYPSRAWAPRTHHDCSRPRAVPGPLPALSGRLPGRGWLLSLRP